jgi:hypothetical protein
MSLHIHYLFNLNCSKFENSFRALKKGMPDSKHAQSTCIIIFNSRDNEKCCNADSYFMLICQHGSESTALYANHRYSF